MSKVTFDYSKTAKFIREEEVQSMSKIVDAAKQELVSREGLGNDFLGWIDLPVAYDKEEFARIKKRQKRLKMIQKCCWSLVSEGLIWERERLLNF